MPLSLIVATGYNFSDGEKVTYPKLNLLGTPSVTFTGELSSAQLSDGAVTTGKLEQGININSKIDDHNLSLTKLEAGTQGQILYYNADGDLVKLAPGSDGQFLKTKGAGANPEWAAQDGTGSINISQLNTDGANKLISTDGSGTIQWQSSIGLLPSIAPSGSIAYFDGSSWVVLGLGASGTILQSNGATPSWETVSTSAFAAKGRFACSGTSAVSYTGDTNIASATYNKVTGPSTYNELTINFSNSVSTDLPIWVRCEYGSSGELELALVETNSRNTSAIVLIARGSLTDPIFNVMIAN
jgi:hypothetical protein